MPDWELDARPVLGATYGLLEDPQSFVVTSVTVAKTVGREHTEVARILTQLSEAGYLATENSIDQTSGEIMVEVNGLTEKSLQQLAGWPAAGASSDVATQLVGIIEARMIDANPDERSRLERLRTAVTDVGTDVITEVLAKLVAQQI